MHRVRFLPSDRVEHVPPGRILLEAALAAGLPVARSCDGGALCGRCGLRIVSGAEALEPESPEETEAKQRNRVPPELRLACCTRVHGDVEVTASYW